MYKHALVLIISWLVFSALATVTPHLDINYDHTPYDASYASMPKLPGRRRLVPGLYKRKYSNITWIGAHNSDALRTLRNGWSLSGG